MAGLDWSLDLGDVVGDVAKAGIDIGKAVAVDRLTGDRDSDRRATPQAATAPKPASAGAAPPPTTTPTPGVGVSYTTWIMIGLAVAAVAGGAYFLLKK